MVLQKKASAALGVSLKSNKPPRILGHSWHSEDGMLRWLLGRWSKLWSPHDQLLHLPGHTSYTCTQSYDTKQFSVTVSQQDGICGICQCVVWRKQIAASIVSFPGFGVLHRRGSRDGKGPKLHGLWRGLFKPWVRAVSWNHENPELE